MNPIDQQLTYRQCIHTFIITFLIINLITFLLPQWFLIVDKFGVLLVNGLFVAISVTLYFCLFNIGYFIVERKKRKISISGLILISGLVLLLSVIFDIIIYIHVISNMFSSVFVYRVAGYLPIATIIVATRVADILFYQLFFNKKEKKR